MLHALVTFAQEEAEEPSKVPFYVAGIILVVWALAVATVGIRNERFGSESRTAHAVMAVTGVLVVATMAMAVVTG